MKGTIVNCMEDLVKAKFGEAKWKECLKASGFPESKLFSTIGDVPDADVLKLMGGIAKSASLGMPQLMDAFGEHWCVDYAPRIYGTYFNRAKSVKELLLSLDQIHVAMTKSMAGAHPPRFTYEWQGEKHLVMQYDSSRNLVALMPGLVKGLSKKFGENVGVSVVGNAVHVQF